MRTATLLFICISIFTLAPVVSSPGAEPSPTASATPAATTSATPVLDDKQKAIEVANKVPAQMGLLKLTKYVSVAVDRNDPPDVLNDSDIKAFIPPIMLSSDLIMVLCVPADREAGPFLAVYVDRRLMVVRGYLLGPKQRDR